MQLKTFCVTSGPDWAERRKKAITAATTWSFSSWLTVTACTELSTKARHLITPSGISEGSGVHLRSMRLYRARAGGTIRPKLSLSSLCRTA